MSGPTLFVVLIVVPALVCVGLVFYVETLGDV